jgi:RNA recognition motif-containing protein
MEHAITNGGLMCRYGSIASSKAIIDQKTGECKGYGFAMFHNEQECEGAIEGLNKAGLQASFARVGQVSFYWGEASSLLIYMSRNPSARVLDIFKMKHLPTFTSQTCLWIFQNK